MLLLDEPLGALDLKLREQMQVELKSIQSDVGITFIYVTHDQEEALTMSDRVAVFNEGRIEQVGPPAEIYERPGNPFVAGFVGTSNLLERNGERFTVRPEKVRLVDGEHEQRTAYGTRAVVDVAYAGMITRYLVELEAGGHAPGRASEPGDRLRRRSSNGRDTTWSWGGCRNIPSPSPNQRKRERRRYERTVEEPGPRGLAARRGNGLDRVRGRLRR